MHIDLVGDKQTAMPQVDSSVDSLRIWHCRYRTVTLVGTLRGSGRSSSALFRMTPRGVPGFIQRHLRELTIMHLPKVRDLSPLADLRRLERLGLSTLPSWDASGKVVTVRSLKPIADLPRLKYLTLFGIVPKTRSLAALSGCKKLIAARFLKYRKAEVRRFYETSNVASEYPEEQGAG